MTRRISVVLALLAVLALVSLRPAAAETVDLALVIANDTSRSIDDSEHRLQRQGYARAMTDPRVLAAIRAGRSGRIAVCFVEWAHAVQKKVVIDWTVIGDEASAKAWADKVLAEARSFSGSTAIGAGIDFAMEQFPRMGVTADRLVIDVAGDGTNNNGRYVTEARDDAVKAGVTINGLAIINEHPAAQNFAHVQPPGGLDRYYEENVIGGTGAFVMSIRDFQAFAAAMVSKLIKEIADASAAD
jgi:hypothetical protein